MNNTLEKWTILIIGLIALFLLLQPLLLSGVKLSNIEWLPRWFRRFMQSHWVVRPARALRLLAWALPFLLLILLNLAIPWLYIQPQLGG